MSAFFVFAPLSVQHARAAVRSIVFPMLGDARYSDDFGAPRVGHTHEGNDIFAEKLRPVVAAVDGFVRWAVFPEPSWGWGIEIEDLEGYRYRYLHLNNDAPGTDNGIGGGRGAYAPGMISGAPVVRGQVLGYVGDSGNAETTASHLHFEIRMSNDTPIDPYESLQASTHITVPVPRLATSREFFPYGQFQGGASIAMGELNGDSTEEEIVTGAGPGGGPHVRVFDTSGDVLSQFFAYPQNFRGGMDVATGDVTGDGIAEIMTGAGPGGGPQVRIFRSDGALVGQFFAYDPTMTQGIRVAAADLTGDGIAEIIAVPSDRIAATVHVFDSHGTLLSSFPAYPAAFLGGADIAAYPATDTFPAVIVTGAGIGGGPLVRIFDMDGTVRGQFFPYDQGFRGGVRVSIADFYSSSPGPEIFVAPASHGGPNFQAFSLRAQRVAWLSGFEEWWTGGYDIAVGTDNGFATSAPGGRQASVWKLRTVR